MARKRNRETLRQIDLLRAIRMNEPISGPQLAKIFNRSRQAIHLRLKMMERRGLIERIVPPPEAPVVPMRYRCSYKINEMEGLERVPKEHD
jgi:DNA-binding Lrp family transcriptional regulator